MKSPQNFRTSQDIGKPDVAVTDYLSGALNEMLRSLWGGGNLGCCAENTTPTVHAL